MYMMSLRGQNISCTHTQGIATCFQRCPDGFYSLGGATAGSCTVCPAGQFCFDGSDYIAPQDCLAGDYSRSGETVCSACELGTYSSAAASVCTSCPPGSQCADPSADPTTNRCASGYYSLGGTVSLQFFNIQLACVIQILSILNI